MFEYWYFIMKSSGSSNEVPMRDCGSFHDVCGTNAVFVRCADFLILHSENKLFTESEHHMHVSDPQRPPFEVLEAAKQSLSRLVI